MPSCAVLPLTAGILTALHTTTEQLEALIRSSANGSTSRSHRLSLVTATECLLHVYHCAALDLMQVRQQERRNPVSRSWEALLGVAHAAPLSPPSPSAPPFSLLWFP